MLDAASQTSFTGSESNVRHSGGVQGSALFRAIFGLELDGGKAVARGNHSEQVSTSQRTRGR